MTDSSTSAVYELTVAGTVGPVVRAVLETTTRASYERLTIVRVHLPSEGDLVELVARLTSRGHDINAVSVLT